MNLTSLSPKLLRRSLPSQRTPLSRFTQAACACISIFAASGLAQDLTHKAPSQSAPIAIINAAIHPVSAPSITKGYILFDKGRIVKIVQGEAPTDLPASVTIIDVAGKHVYPGFISPYTQIGLTEIQAVASSIDMAESARIAPEVIAVSAVNPDSTLIPVTRSNGILSAAVFPTGGLISGQPSVIRLDGWTTTEMTIRRSCGIAMTWPNMRTFTAWWMNESEEDQQRNIRRDSEAITKLFETAQSYALAKQAEGSEASFNTDLRWEAMLPIFPPAEDASTTSKAQPARLFIRANTIDQIQAAVAFAKANKLKIVIIGGRDAALCGELLKAEDIPVIVLGTLSLPTRDDDAYDAPYTLPARLAAAGIKFALSHNDDTAHERNLPYQAAMAVAFGLDRDLAIKSLTLWAAEITGVDEEIGSLDAGKAATLFISSGDPLEITTRIERAFIDGRAIDLSNKHTKLAEKYRERYRQQKAESAK